MNYARRNGIEDGLGTNVNFFHMDNLSSEVRLNVDLDVMLTVNPSARPIPNSTIAKSQGMFVLP
ncbi:MAG: hypothetical protein CMJ64_28980 [Planctomycetaceae bacterium]|jgi:hypothetical protein|nr:hypothetical protein [Planctomycetaceae bacterium]